MATVKEMIISIEARTRSAEQRLANLKQSTDKLASSTGRLRLRWTELNQGIELIGRGFRAAEGAFRSTFEALDRAQVVEGVTKGFENLQKQAGLTADESLNKLRSATQGLVSDFDLMQQANQAAQLGLDPTNLDVMAEAATKLGAAVGRTAQEAFTDLITGVGRASPLILDNLGITIKAAEAQEIYAASIGKTVSQLTEEEKARAFQEAALIKITQKAAELDDVQLNAGQSATRLRAAYRNLIDEFLEAINTNEDLARAFSIVAEAISGIDIRQLVTDFGRGLSTIINVVSDWSSSFVRGADIITRAVNGLKSDFVTGLEAIKNTVTQTVNVVQMELVDRLNSITDRIRENVDAITGFFKDMAEAVSLGSYVPDMVDIIVREFGSLNTVMVEPARSATNAVAGAFESLQLNASQSLSTLLQDIGLSASAASSLSGGLVDALGSIGNDLLAGVSDSLGIGDILGDVVGGIGLPDLGSLGLAGLDVNSLLGGGIGALSGIAIGGLANVAGDLFGGGGDPLEKARRDVREQLQQTGLGENLQFQTTGGLSKSLLDIDFAAINDEIGQLNPQLQAGLDLTQALAQAVTGGGENAEAFNTIFAQAVGDADSYGEVLLNVTSLMDTMGVTSDQAKEQLLQLFKQNAISLTEFESGLQQLNKVAERDFGNMQEKLDLFTKTMATQPGLSLKVFEGVMEEMKDLGIDNFSEMGDYVMDRFGPGIADAFRELSDRGINSIGDLNLQSADHIAALFRAFEGLRDDGTAQFEMLATTSATALQAELLNAGQTLSTELPAIFERAGADAASRFSQGTDGIIRELDRVADRAGRATDRLRDATSASRSFREESGRGGGVDPNQGLNQNQA